MPAIPQVDITINLKDTGYRFRFDEGDGSTSLGTFGLEFPFIQPNGLGGYNQSFANAFNPRYNTQGSAMTPTPTNFTLGPSAPTPFIPTGAGSLPLQNLWGFDGVNFLQITWTNPAGTIKAQLTSWPGVIDYSLSSATTLTITNPGNTSAGGIFPVKFTDGSSGFVLWALVSNGMGFTNQLLPILADLSTPVGWVTDPSPFINTNGAPTVTSPQGGANIAGDFSNQPTMAVWTVTFDITDPTNMIVAWSGQPIQTVVVDAGNAGAGYAPGDTGQIVQGSNVTALYVVDTVDGGGGVLTLHLTAAGTDYFSAFVVPTVVTSGAGDGNLFVDITIGPQAAQGDVSTDAANALLAQGWFGSSSWYYTPIGFFGIDYTGFTGCWYCKYDCTAFGRVIFVMPDASGGPADPNAAWILYGNVSSLWQFWPNWDIHGVPWWIRVPLQSGGVYELEPLTGEVYTLGAAPPAGGGRIFGTNVAVVQAGQVSGGSQS